MRRRLIVLAVMLLLLFAACGGGDDDDKASAGLPTRTVEAGEVEVKVEPERIDDTGAVFDITLDTHSVELATDLAREARLEVGTSTWKAVAWSGAGPSGHHREGTLRFDATGPAEGTARLVIGGLPAPVDLRWDLRRPA